MNRKQRERNRNTAKTLRAAAMVAESMRHICPECGEPGFHWMQIENTTLEHVISGVPPRGFWTCAKFYGPDGRRIAP